MKLTKLLNEGKLNELNPKLNKKVKSYMDAYLKGIPASSPEFHHTVMMVLKGALTDANFHSEAKKLDAVFPKAKKSKYYDNSNMNDVMEDKGVDIAGWAKWDGHDILDAFSYYTNMTIGGGTGGKLESLKESISELIESEMLAEASYSSKLTEGKFKVDDLVYNKRTKTVGIVRMGDDKYGEVKTDADGNVNVDELEKYNPIKNKHQNNAKVAPSTEKEVSKRGLFNPFKNESQSITEEAGKEAMGIAALTGTRGVAVQDFINKHNLDAAKLFKFVEKGKLPERMMIVSALAGRPGNTVQNKIIKQFSESMKLSSLVEAGDTYFKSASEAADSARAMAEKKGYEIDENDWHSQIALGGKYNRLRPGVGKTHSFIVQLLKNGKPQRKALSISLYGMASGNYELTTYIN
jgi:hypothetical protein